LHVSHLAAVPGSRRPPPKCSPPTSRMPCRLDRPAHQDVTARGVPNIAVHLFKKAL
jgi:hypothetical protein